MKNLTKSIVTITILGSFAFAAPSAKDKFRTTDLNNDGVITQEEFYNEQARKMEKKAKEGRALKGASTAPQFEMVDSNKNGQITFDEYDKFHIKRQKQMKEIRKGNGEGKGAQRGLVTFNKYDRNGDGYIDKDEFRPIFKKLNNNKGNRKGNNKGNGKGNGNGRQ